ncbi:MAG: HAMP domain-containing histidine kinase [Muribaculaceae bacterium]|nr:HAMP domain-containing histidine kinase [Muribaculaceae bacterium]
MGLKKRRLNYHWRLFIPIVLILWIIIATMMAFQFRRERTARAEEIKAQLMFINSRIIDSYEDGLIPESFLDFIGNYYDDDVFHEIMVSVYDIDGDSLLLGVGQPLPNSDSVPNSARGVGIDAAHLDATLREAAAESEMFYYSVDTTKDGKVRSIIAMPYSVSLADTLAADPEMWIVTIILTLIATFIAYWATRYLSRNIRLLRDFTNHAATASAEEFLYETRFPADELGDISRQIVNIYNKRAQAVKDLEYEHRMAMKATKEKSRIKRQLTNNINHELKTPIGIIKGYVDTILENPDMSDEQRNTFLKKVSANVDRLCSMLNDMSTITRLEENGENIPTETIDFHELLFTVADEVRESGMLKDMTFTYDLPFDCYVKGNISLLNGMLLNLTKNAINYSKGTEIGLKLVAENQNFYTFSFFDNGVGVEDKHLPFLFDRFYRVDSGRSRKVGGTGLGLPIVKSTVLSLGGTISVQNRPEGGLEFMFTLPKAPKES